MSGDHYIAAGSATAYKLTTFLANLVHGLQEFDHEIVRLFLLLAVPGAWNILLVPTVGAVLHVL